MIGKHIDSPSGHSSFKGLNDYITGKSNKDHKVLYTDCLNLASVKTASFEMETLAFQNKRCGDPVMHLLLSWRENENPTREQATEAVKITLDEMGLSECQAVYSLHQNTDNMHLHISINRVHPDTKKAINPAHGWTHNGMERAARRIEYAQNWQVENNARSEINARGEVVKRADISLDNEKIPQKPKDKEIQTGEQSAIRKAQQELKNMDVSSWKDLHNFMQSRGMKYQNKGSGAVIFVGEIAVKASQVSRNYALNKLEKRFGVYQSYYDIYQENSLDIEKISAPKPLDKVNDNANWKAYIEDRKTYYLDKRQQRQKTNMSHGEQRKAMKERQAAERRALFGSLKGKGHDRRYIGEQRAVLATRHAYEAVLLKEEQKKRRGEYQKQNPTYPTYEQWLRDRGLSSEADGWRHRKNKGFFQIEPAEGAEPGKPEPVGLPGFRMEISRQGTRFYSGQSAEAAFIDSGRLIRVYRHDGESLLAALQLGQEKWGGVKLTGSDEYKRRCAELAAEHGIRIVNPELQGIIREETEWRRDTQAQAKDGKRFEAGIEQARARFAERQAREAAERERQRQEQERLDRERRERERQGRSGGHGR
jgi:hypothetical protein